ncbi:hypothetical protein [Paenibacillus segetis]|uniref:DUF4190 domain-containing protein n=1 Tax=Paenibacillus segetis TaxID=1325360 RepID=A0ABQ1YGB9_9BACL|nr:hypothetical protein [Paenibacillus segetis]GGH23658.1 hypothetical protein GCM10008013_22930 [Paenibacillus segetis]
MNKKNNTMALVGFILGLVSLLINFWGLVGIVACVFSGVGLGTFNAELEKNRWMAIVGLILGIFSILYGVISLLA